MLGSRSAARLLPRSRTLLRRMSSIYVLPIDPSAPAATAAPVDATKLWHTTPASNTSKPSKAGTTHLFYGGNIAAVSSLGDKFAQKKGDDRREVVRKTVGSAIKKVRELGEAVDGSKVVVDASADPHAAGTSLFYTQSYARTNVSRYSCRCPPRTLPFHPQDKACLRLRSTSHPVPP